MKVCFSNLTAVVRERPCCVVLNPCAELLPLFEAADVPAGARRAGADREGGKAKGGGSRGKAPDRGPTMLDQFVAQKPRDGSPAEADEDDDMGAQGEGFVEHPDGTLSLAGPGEAPP